LNRRAENTELVVDGYLIPEVPLVLAYHKPKDVISAMKDSRYCLGDALQGLYTNFEFKLQYYYYQDVPVS